MTVNNISLLDAAPDFFGKIVTGKREEAIETNYWKSGAQSLMTVEN